MQDKFNLGWARNKEEKYTLNTHKQILLENFSHTCTI